MAKSKEYVQFSKRMVLLVFWGVIVFTVLTLALLLFALNNAPEVVEVFKAFMTFAGAVFVCYSGNSAFEKFVLNRYAGGQPVQPVQQTLPPTTKTTPAAKPTVNN